MKDCNCIFCKIAGGDIPSNVIYEDDKCAVILDASPATKGHALILPKEHYADIFAIEEDMLTHVIQTAKKVATRMKEVLGCEGVNIVQNNGTVAGQTVFHFHMHLVPRYKDAEPMLKWTSQTFSDEEMDALAEKLAVK